ncbi:MAG: YeeE/YedE family protein [Bdellovibrionales bacterium]|nr:YeeE/YedE family protein [Bdellovibrionales bacterium]
MFNTSFFASPTDLLLGALTGFAFGFLLQKGSVTKFNTIVRQFLLQDFTVIKVMLTAVVVGGIGVYGMLQLGMIEALHIKNAQILGNALGGVIFGVGMAILGYCPGTGAAAIGDGAKDAVAGVLGMLAGAAIYAEVHPWFKANVLSVWDLGKETFVTATGASPWWFVLGLMIVAIAAFRGIEQIEKRTVLGAA